MESRVTFNLHSGSGACSKCGGSGHLQMRGGGFRLGTSSNLPMLACVRMIKQEIVDKDPA